MRSPLALALLSAIALSGCSQGDSSPESTTPSSASQGTDAEHAAAASASQFLRALAKGDEKAATNRLTPLAAEQMAKTGKTFAFSAVDKADFKVTRVWQPQSDEAAVEYRMTAIAGDEAVEFDLCCFMKQVSGDWRLGGIAYDLGDNQEPVVVNYEAIETPRPAADPTQTVGTGAGPQAGTHTAQNPSTSQNR